LALKENNWNAVEVTLRGEQLTITLNGKTAVTESLGRRTRESSDESSSSNRSLTTSATTFGLYHDAARTSLRVRKAVLTGNWPTELSDAHRAAIEWPEPAESLPNLRFFGDFVGEDHLSDNAFEIYRRALLLDAKPRYEFLRRWVLPNSSHDLLRMAGAFTPTHPAPPVAGEHPIDVATKEARQAVDQRLLVLAAAETDRLEELKQEVLKHPPTSSVEMARNRAALLGIIALLEDRPEEAVDALWECQRLISDKEPGPQYARWGDVALASLAIQHPVTQQAAYELLDRIQRKQLQTGKPGTTEYGRYVRHLHGQVHYLMHGGPSEEFGTQPRTKQWRMVPQPSAKSRGEGYPIASFDSFTGELAIRGGHDCDMAYFQSPLRGNYEVSCRLSHLGYRETILMAAGVASAMRYTHNESRVMHIRTKITEVPSPELISPGASNGFEYKIVVRDRRFTSYVWVWRGTRRDTLATSSSPATRRFPANSICWPPAI
ncbi:MAG: tolB, partial [Planctomycetota bacterium]